MTLVDLIGPLLAQPEIVQQQVARAELAAKSLLGRLPTRRNRQQKEKKAA